MFTGIVQGIATVVAIQKQNNFRTHTVHLPTALLGDLEIGDSIAHNGCCLTATSIDGHHASFDLIQATLAITNLGGLVVGDHVNVERAARVGDDIGGHLMSGHIMCTAEVVEVSRNEHNHQIRLRLPPLPARYIFTQGYIGLDGISLTIGEVDGDIFCVNLIPETLKRTTIVDRRKGDRVNVEIDPQTQVTVDTVERFMSARYTSPDYRQN